MVPQLPAMHPRAHLVLVTTGARDEVGEHRISLSLHDPNGTVTLEHNGVIGMGDPPPGVEEVEAPGVLVIDLPVEQAGPHAIVVTIDGTEAARVPFTVGVQQPISAQGTVH
jgi:hypothetical protein